LVLPALPKGVDTVGRQGMTAAILTAALGASLLLALGAGSAGAEGFGASSLDAQFRVEWKAGKSRAGAPILEGYIFNTRPTGAQNIRLQIDILDAQGQVIGQTYGNVQGFLQAFDRRYFDVPLPAAGASYRVSVYSWELRGGGGGM
jgi:hypothetical protein